MLKEIKLFFQALVTHKSILIPMVKREVSTQYVGSFLGFIWTFIHPLVMITVFWFVFSVGFKSKPMGDVPFVVWLTAGMAPWFMFADVILGSASVIITNSHLIKKTLFPPQLLIIVKYLSGSVTHFIFLLILLCLIIAQGMGGSLFYLQVFYYYLCLTFLVLGISWAVSALNVFIRDVGHVAGVLIQVGFWATPIFWDIKIMPANIQFFIKLNPMYYIVQGYRDTFISFEPFWNHIQLTAYFWGVVTLFFIIGTTIFIKLKPQFADTL